MSGAVVVLVLPQQQQQQQQQQVMLMNGYGSGEQGSEESLEQAQELLSQDKKSLSSMLAQRAMHERRLKPPDHIIPCPRCQSINTKFCYYNNYSLTQPRHFCKNCRRYWTAGGTLRNVPVGGGCRKNKRVKRNSTDASNASSVESSVCGFRSDGVNGGAAQSVHQSFLQGASAGSSFFESPQYDEATKAAIARAQQVIRAGSSGVGHSSHESSPGSDGPAALAAPSLTTQPFDSGIMSQGFFAPAPKHDGAPTLSNGDLSSIFEAHAYRAAAAAAGAPPMGGEGLNGYSHHHVSDVEGYGGGHHVEGDGHGHWRMQQKPGDMWEEEQPQREEAVLMPHSSDHHRKSSAAAHAHAHVESLRHALKGKSSLCLSPSSGLDEEGTSPCSVWAPTNPSLNPYESAQDAGFNWPGSWTTPLELMPASGVQFGMRSEHLFDLPKQNLVNPVGFGLDEFHSDNRKLA